LAVGINQQHTSIGRTSASQQSGDAKGSIGGGCRFADTPFVIGEKKASHDWGFLRKLIRRNRL
jgi:hypothetical protein